MDVLSFGVCVKRCVQTGVKSQRITVIGRRISGQIDVSKSLLGVPAMDIYDISWCPNSQFLVRSGTDSNIIIWGIDGTQYTRIHDHTGYIQGVDWSQDDMNIISVANDRTARIYNYTKFPVNTKLQVDDWNSIRPFREDFRISKNLVNNRPCTY